VGNPVVKCTAAEASKEGKILFLDAKVVGGQEKIPSAEAYAVVKDA
jgi:hypothetical protein